MYNTKNINDIRVKTIREKDLYCFEDIMKKLEKDYDLQYREFFDSPIFEDASKNKVLSEETYKEIKEMIDKVIYITTEHDPKHKDVPYADFWHWLTEHGGFKPCPKTKIFKISTLIKKAEKQKVIELDYWHRVGNSSCPTTVTVSTKWIIEGILLPLQREYGDVLPVYFVKWCD
jgi:hypothetical protein